MRKQIRRILGTVFQTMLVVLLWVALPVRAQTTAFTYQGRLNVAGNPANGVYDLQFSLFNAASGGAQQSGTWTQLSQGVTNGLFTVELDFGSFFPGANRWLEIGVRTNGGSLFTTLTPRQKFTPAPYAITAANANLANTAYSVPGVRVNTNLSSTALGLNTTASGAASTALGQNTLASGVASTAAGAYANATNDYSFVWADGSSVTPFVSTSNHQFLVRAKGGVGINTNRPQAALHVAGDYALVDGAGGEQAYIGGDAAGFDVQFGSFNTNIYSVSLWNAKNFDYMNLFAREGYFFGPVSIFTTNPSAPALTVDGTLRVNGGIGGLQSVNLLAGTNSVLTIQSVNDPDWGPTANLRAGYSGNTISNGVFGGVISGGGNAGFPNRVGGNYATVGGGLGNEATAHYSTVSGGIINRASGQESTVSGGAFNSALGFSSTVGGGGGNMVTGSWATISGGLNNVITNVSNATIGGGANNQIGTNSTGGTIGGGEVNVIRANSWRATVAGGFVNTVGAPEGTVSGGAFNSALAYSSTVGGGGGNAASGAWSVVAGGRDNAVTNADYATIGGGIQNRIDPGATYAVIAGGGGNLIYSNAHFATIPGGRYNAAANYAFAAGNRAKANHAGTFVWSDTVDADFASSGENQFLIRAGGGVAINTNNSGGAALTVNGKTRLQGDLETAGLKIEAVDDWMWGPTFNIKAGFSGNIISNAFPVYGAFIGGGGNASYPNRVLASYGSVLGGMGNTASGFGSVAGGTESVAYGSSSVALGYRTTASGDHSTALGQQAIASGFNSFASGENCFASALASTAMGYNSWAIGSGSTALGVYSRANHNNTLVWSDGSSTSFGSTSTNQFLVKAVGGVGINTNNPGGAALSVNGNQLLSGSLTAREATISTELFVTGLAYLGGVSMSGPGNIGGDLFVNGSGTFGGTLSVGSVTSIGGNILGSQNITVSGRGGIGTLNPQTPLHVYSANNPAVLRVQSTGTPGFGRLEFLSNPQGDINEWRPAYIQSTDAGGFTGGLSFVVNGTGVGSKFAEVEAMRIQNGRVGIGNNAPSTLLQVGNATCNGTTWNNASDRNLKENFKPVDSQAVLAKVAALSLTEWNYKTDSGTRHIGPMAQDFSAAFGTGSDDRHIATVDADGVALAAIQGLNQKLEETRSELKRRDEENAALKTRLEKLEQALGKLVKE